VPRPPWRVWGWAAATIALVLVAAVLWRSSDAAATSSRTAAPGAGPSGTPAGDVSPSWSVPGALPVTVVAGRRVLVGSLHGVRALDPVSGAEVWHYTRSNARVCGLTVVNDLAIAVYRTASRCNEVVALRADTGVRAWTRNLNLRGDATLVSTDRIVLAISPTGLLTLDPVGDNVRWRYRPAAGCVLLDAAAGHSGVALLQQCGSGAPAQLRLLDGFAGTTHWSRDVAAPSGTRPRLVDADQLIGVQVGAELRLLSGNDGSALRTLPVRGPDSVVEEAAGSTALVRIGNTLTALEDTTGRTRWVVPAVGLPAPPAASAGTLTPPVVVVPDPAGFTRRNFATGAELGSSAVRGLPAGGTASAFGATIVYRLPDRVLAFR
jgi:outer membrane protein assembly factor BamB